MITVPSRIRPRAVVCAAAGFALVMAACGGSSVSEDRLRDDLVSRTGITEAQASCVVDHLFEELDQGQIDDMYSEDGRQALDRAQTTAYEAAVEDCVAS